MNAETIAVFGASGRIGMAQVRMLQKAGCRTIAVTRQAEVFADPRYKDVEVRDADFASEESIRKALRGVDGVFLQFPSLGHPPILWGYNQNMVKALRASAGVRKVVLNSTMWSPDAPPCGEPLYDHVRRVEELFLESRLPVVVVRPVLFMDNLLTNLVRPGIVNDGVYRYCQRPGLEANWIAMDDVARYMWEAFKRDDLLGKRILLGGPERLKIEEVVEIVADAVGRPVKFDYMPPRQYGEYLFDLIGTAAGPTKQAAADWFDSFYTFNNESPLKPFQADVAALDQLIPLKAVTMREWAKRQDWRGEEGQKIGSGMG